MAAVIGALRADLSASVARFEQDMGKAAEVLKKFGREAKSVANTLTSAGQTMTVALTAPVVALGAAVGKTAGTYEAAMNRVEAATQSSGAELEALNKKARDIGRSFENTASAIEAADAMEILAKNGLNVTQILEGATDATVKLAAATGAQLAPAADVATDVMLQFGKQAKDLDGVVDGIVGTLLESKFGFEDYALALGQAGGVAGGLGVKFNEFNAVIAATGALFSGGSDAGTSFKTFLVSLSGGTSTAANAIKKYGLSFYDANGNMKSMVEITEQLNDKLGHLNDREKTDVLQKIFGRDAMRTAIGLMATGAERLAEIDQAIQKASAQDQMDALMKGLNGALKQMKNAFVELMIAIGESGLLDVMASLVLRVRDLFTWLGQLPAPVLAVATAVGAFVAALGPALWLAGAFAGALANLAAPAQLLMTMMPALAAKIAGLASMIVPAIAAFAPWIIAIGAVIALVWKFRGVFAEAFGFVVNYAKSTLGPALSELFGAFQSVVKGIVDLFTKGPLAAAIGFLGWVVAEVAGIILQVAGGAIVRALTVIVKAVTTMVNTVAGILKIFGALLRGDFAGAWEAAVDTVTGFIDNLLDVFDTILPGIRSVIEAVISFLQRVFVAGVRVAIQAVVRMFPWLPNAIKAAAQAVVGWARWMFNGVKQWIVDNLGPQIKWARDRIRELTTLWNRIRQRRAQVEGTAAPRSEAAPAVQDRAAPRVTSLGDYQMPDDAGGGGGGSRAANSLANATKAFKDAIEDANDEIDKGLARGELPRSIQRANDLRKKLDEAEQEAREAGVAVGGFADQLAAARERIDQLEQAGLAEEARDFAKEVRRLSGDVADLSGGMGPLEDELRAVDQQFDRVRERIVEAIRENRVLAESNAAAKAAMEDLERQLAALDRAYTKATEATRKMHQAQKELRDLQAASDRSRTAEDIRALQERSGRSSSSSRDAARAAIERDLQEQRWESEIELSRLRLEMLEAEQAGDEDQLSRLRQQYALQEELHGLITSTTARQIENAEREMAAFDSFEKSMGDALTRSVDEWKFQTEDFWQAFRQLGSDLFTKPFMDDLSSMMRNFLQGLFGGSGGGGAGFGEALKGFGSQIASFFGGFGGGFAKGGHLTGGKWGFAGEEGLELIKAGAGGLSVMSNPDLASMMSSAPSGVTINVTTPDADSFNYNRRQIGRSAREAMGM